MEAFLKILPAPNLPQFTIKCWVDYRSGKNMGLGFFLFQIFFFSNIKQGLQNLLMILNLDIISVDTVFWDEVNMD